MLNEFERNNIVVDSTVYNVFLKKQLSLAPEHPRLVIVSYVPQKKIIKLVKIAVNTIRKYTTIPYELWIVDNNSPKKNLKWMLKQKDINLVLNKTEPESPDGKYKGSYANGVALEIAKQLVDPETKYFMTLHQDIAVCRKDWLQYLLQKFDEKTRAVGVRMDTARVKDGILHVLGYIVDFQVLKKNNLSFMPSLPDYDTGDKLIVELKKMGFDIFSTQNTLWSPELVNSIDANAPLKEINVDRSFNENGDVFFMHLGRGVLKAANNYNIKNGLTIDKWYSIIKRHYL